jgi:hypothetical protein
MNGNRTGAFLPFLLFGLALTVVCLCHISTVRVYPTPWGDEVNLLELGRCAVFERNTDWSIILSPCSSVDKLQPDLFPTYIGGAVTELLFRATGTFITHRLFSIAGLACASLLCCIWLVRKGYSPWTAALGAFLFATECHISRIAHFYRPDLWILAIVFLCLLWIMRLEAQPRLRQYFQFGLLGCVLAFHVLYWFSAVFSWPILLAEALLLAERERWRGPTYILVACAVGTGFLLGVLLFLVLPFYRDLWTMLGLLIHHPDLVNIQSSLQPATDAWSRLVCGLHLFYGNARTVLMLAARSPFLWTLSGLGFLWALRSNRILCSVLSVQLVIMLATTMYAQRIVYLLPGAVLLAALAMKALSESRPIHAHPGFCRALHCYYGLAAAFGLAVVLAINLIAGWGGTGESDRFRDAIRKTIGVGPKRVYVFSWQPYFHAREFGWKLFSFLPINARAILEPNKAAFLQSMDYILSNDETNGLDGLLPLTKEEEACLASHGFVKCASIPTKADVESPFVGKCKAAIYSYAYPSFTVWKNQRSPAAP